MAKKYENKGTNEENGKMLVWVIGYMGQDVILADWDEVKDFIDFHILDDLDPDEEIKIHTELRDEFNWEDLPEFDGY